jgi:hypothetical protein
MATWLVPLLVLAWVVYLAPAVFRGRRRVVGQDSVNGFYRQIGVLARTSPSAIEPANPLFVPEDFAPPTPVAVLRPMAARPNRPVPVPSHRARLARRRRRILATLLIATLASGGLDLLPSLGGLVPLTVALIILLAGYVALLALARPHPQRAVGFRPAGQLNLPDRLGYPGVGAHSPMAPTLAGAGSSRQVG